MALATEPVARLAIACIHAKASWHLHLANCHSLMAMTIIERVLKMLRGLLKKLDIFSYVWILNWNEWKF